MRKRNGLKNEPGGTPVLISFWSVQFSFDLKKLASCYSDILSSLHEQVPKINISLAFSRVMFRLLRQMLFEDL